MKKVCFAVLALLLCIGLWACGNQEQPEEETAIVPTLSQPATENTKAVAFVEDVENKDEHTVKSYYDEDGNLMETYDDEAGNTIVVCTAPDGSITETHNNTDGSMVSIYHNPATGEYIETEFSKDWVRVREKSYNPSTDRHVETGYYANGNLKWSHVQQPSAGFTSEQEYHENGNRKWIKTTHPDEEMEARYNEEAYCTYYHSSWRLPDGSPYEIECFGDETGNLTKIIENGVETEDEKLFDQYIKNCNFRQ